MPEMKERDKRLTEWRRAEAIKMREEERLTYQQIADRMGVSKAYIGLLLNDYNKNKRFHIVTDESVPIPGLAKWMNEHQISQVALVRMMGYAPATTNFDYLKRKVNGDNMKKRDIDKLISITGMTYEQLFGRQ